MHFYACPYCWPKQRGREGKLIVVKSAEVPCDHKGGFFDKEKDCRAENYKCKEVMHCTYCSAEFKITEEFLSQQKRKIKDG